MRLTNHFRFVLKSLLLCIALQANIGFCKSDQAAQDTLPLDDLQRFAAVVEQIRKYYVEPVDDKALFENAIRGMLSGLDPHSAYLDPGEFSDLRANTSGRFGGLGIEVTMDDGLVKVISAIDDTPAQRAGIKSGDLIVRLDDTPVKGLTLKKAVEIMRGERGKPILLTVIRKGDPHPLKIKVLRDVIQVKSIKTRLLDKQYGYIRISQFQTQSAEDMVAAIEKLEKESNGNLKGIILDLRNNPGGILESSVKVSDAFLDRAKLKYDGTIVYTEGRLPGSELKEKAHDGDVLSGAPIVVLVNGGSASASEIVAGALQDHHRAMIVGTRTFGKGSVQTVLPLKDNHGLKLTTALYFTPAGRSIQAEGIVPDIEIADLKMPTAQNNEEEEIGSIRESNLEGHLKNSKESPAKNLDTSGLDEATVAALNKRTEKDENKTLLAEDYQLNEALNLLKGLVFIEPRNTTKTTLSEKAKSKLYLPQQAN